MTKSSIMFGKHVEYFIASLMMKDGLSVYFPLADDHGVDAIVEKPNGGLAKVQIKGSSKNNKYPGFFIVSKHVEQANYYFVFYAERTGTIWLFSSGEFVKAASKGRQSEWNINLCGTSKGKPTINPSTEEHIIYPALYGRQTFKRILDE